jgi:hypothetical protein
MAALSYLDFDLLLEKSDLGYKARVVQSPAGQAVSNFTVPVSDLELENFLLRVGQSRSTARRGTGTSEKEAVKAFGGTLFDSVFTQDVLKCFGRSLDEAKRKNLAYVSG